VVAGSKVYENHTDLPVTGVRIGWPLFTVSPPKLFVSILGQTRGTWKIEQKRIEHYGQFKLMISEIQDSIQT
jgi:hypothetical protein